MTITTTDKQAALISTIKAHISAGDKAQDKAQQHYIAAGQHLKTLKASHTGTWAEWEALLKDKIGLGKSRASELMQIADGTKTAKQVRDASAKRKEKERTKSLRDVTEKRQEANDAEASAEQPVTETATTTTETAPSTVATQVPLDRNPICHAWRLASEDERAKFAHLFGDDVHRYADDLRRPVDDHHQDADGDDDIPEAKANPPRKRKKKLQETRLSAAVADAFGELQDLACEVRDVVDNTPENLSQTPRILTLDETAGVLEDLSKPTVSAELAEIKVSLPEFSKPRSRADRRGTALGNIAACVAVLDSIDESDPRHQEARSLRDELENASSEAEACEFSGMYG